MHPAKEPTKEGGNNNNILTRLGKRRGAETLAALVVLFRVHTQLPWRGSCGAALHAAVAAPRMQTNSSASSTLAVTIDTIRIVGDEDKSCFY